MEKHTYTVNAEFLCHEHRDYAQGEEIHLSPRQAANWLSTGQITLTVKPAASKKSSTKRSTSPE